MAVRINHLECKTLGHSWDPIASNRPSPFGEPITCRCVCCGTTRRHVISPHDGAILSRTYKYPDGYKNAERMSKAELRMVLARRIRRGQITRRFAA